MKVYPLLASYLLLLPGCATSPSGNDPALGGLATAGAVMVALPLSPLAAGAQLVAAPIQARNEQEFWKKYDPLFARKMALLRARDPRADARKGRRGGATAFLQIQGLDVFPGLMETEYRPQALPAGFLERNRAVIERHPFLAELDRLAGMDLEFLQAEKKYSFSATYREFLSVAFHYKEAFNREMYRLNRPR